MKNTIVAYIEFSFKGERLTPSTIIDLDHIMEQNGTLNAIYSILARSNNIDTYSYEYEIMQSVEVTYKDPQGIAEKHLIDGSFAFENFQNDWHYNKTIELLNDIAKKHLSIDDIEQHDDIKNALLEAYNHGKTEYSRLNNV